MEKLLRRVAIAVIASMAFPALAYAGEDEQWPIPNTPELGHHSVLIEESIDFFKLFSFVETTEAISGQTVFCSSLSDPGCTRAQNFHVNAGFSVCGKQQDADCVESLRFFAEGDDPIEAEFVEYVYPSHPNLFTGDGILLSTTIGTPTIWRANNAKHEAGDLYLLVAGLKGGVHRSNGGWRNVEVYASLFPVSEFSLPGSGQPTGNFDIPNCTYRLNQDQVKISTGCGSSAADFGQVRCVTFKQNGTCLLRHAHNLTTQIELNLRLLKPASGWIHGRMQQPKITVTDGEKISRISVRANPVRVPSLYSGRTYSDMTPEEKKYWDECLPRGLCSSGTRIAGSDPTNQKDGNLRNILAIEDPAGSRSLGIVPQFAKWVNDTSVAAPTVWSFRTLGTVGEGEVFRCASEQKGLVAMVTTNATAYSEGPPSLSSGMLNYRVAGLHYLPDGKTPHLGTYDLVLRSDVARCLYGFSKAPLSAAITVVGDQGAEAIATKVVSEKDGWLRLSAYGFTFSEKEIKIQITQPQTRTLSDHPGRATALTSKQKQEIKSLLDRAQGNSKFICTGIRLVGQSESMNRTVRLRAKLACDYAKSLNPKLSTFFQTKTTKARSYNGRVLVVSK